MSFDLSLLKKPFPAEDIEWRLQQCGESKGKVWGKCLAYVTNRAIQNRLDDVVGPENWKNEFIKGPDGGILCGLSIKVDGEWVTKWDGAENTQIEAVKGGLSGAMKRAAATGWGIGRYLYNLDEGWADICDDGKFSGKTKEGKWFKWNPPKLPSWALPEGYKQKSSPKDVQKMPEETDEIKGYKNSILDYINAKILTGDFEKKAMYYCENNDVEGLKKTLAWCKEQEKKAS